ncbi:MAG: hypothetical protein LBO20_05795, partial [Bifidobacteriaceae bacterium]|jgi:hypothetical protein|nr:hypothetical protein [Bifidobacteriaceae bacterium]
VVTRAAAQVAEAQRLPETWLSDAVRSVWPTFADPAPRVVWASRGVSLEVASPAYLLTMKAMASRRSQADLDDAAQLCLLLGVPNEAALEDLIRANLPTEAPFGAQKLFFEDIIARARQLEAASPPALPLSADPPLRPAGPTSETPSTFALSTSWRANANSSSDARAPSLFFVVTMSAIVAVITAPPRPATPG